MEKGKTKAIKKLAARCPFFNSGQVRDRKLIGNWKCNTCGKTFKRPKSDV